MGQAINRADRPALTLRRPRFGPWFVGAQNDALFIIDRRPAHGNDHPNHSADVACIARVFDDVRGIETSGRDHANVLAAAPALLDACIEAREWLRGWASAEPYLAVLDAAIAKANGE